MQEKKIERKKKNPPDTLKYVQYTYSLKYKKKSYIFKILNSLKAFPPSESDITKL